MRICYFGTYRKEYSRNKIMIAALESAGIEVIQCHVTLWKGIEDRVEITKGGWKNPSFWWRVLRSYLQLTYHFFKVGDFDILMVGYPGQFDVFLAKIFSVIRKKPLIWDVFMSIYLVAKERGLDNKSKFTVNLIRWIESQALKLPDMLIQDTSDYVEWFNHEYKIPKQNFQLVPTGADDRIFSPRAGKCKKSNNECIVLYYGTFIPNHGVLKIIQAANHLRNNKNIIFEFIGEGPEKSLIEAYTKENNLENVRFLGWLKQDEIVNKICFSDICLGAFGDTPQSLMTVQNKIFECLAMGKPVITGESYAVRNSFPPDTLILCNRNCPKEIADAIIKLWNEPKRRQQLSINGKKVFLKSYNISSLGRIIYNHIIKIIDLK